METIVNPIIDETIIFIETSKQTNGKKTLMEVHLGPKGGNPLHYHKRFSESFKIIEGQLNVRVGKEIKILNQNETATAPIGTVHRFYNTSGKFTKFTCELSPASEGFENVLRIGCGLANDGKAGKNGLPKSLLHMAITMNMGEGYAIGIFSILEKFFRFLAKTPKAKRIEEELLAKYCNT